MPSTAPIFYRHPSFPAPGSLDYAVFARCPRKWLLTFSGWTGCTACCGGTPSYRITGGTLNTAIEVDRLAANGCEWLYEEAVPTTVTGERYSLAACAGVVTALTDFRVWYRKSGGLWRLDVTLGGFSLFTSTGATPAATFTNGNGACSCPSVMGHSGSATGVVCE